MEAKRKLINKYVIWLSDDEYENLSKKYQMQKISEYELQESIIPDW